MTHLNGTVAPGYEPVADAFAQNFADGLELGAAVAVYRDGRPVVDLWGGVADAITGRPWERDTLILVHSTTKGATAACAHLLVQCGQLDLDAPVARYWPEFAAAGKEHIPVRWLLSHRAGLSTLDRLPVAEFLRWDPVVEMLAAREPDWEPGTAHGYHAMTYGFLVGEVVRRISGMSLGTFFATEIAEPLGLDFHIGLSRVDLPRVGRLVEPPGFQEVLATLDATSLAMRSTVVTSDHLDMNDPAVQLAEIPAGNGICTADALARMYAGFIGEVDGVRILDAATIAAATAEQANGPDLVLGIPTRPALGFGLWQPGDPWYTPTAFGFPGHGGSIGYADPGTGITLGYVMNRMHLDLTPDQRAVRLLEAVRKSL
jgi:CubicO group peptidase (beta-lactamase class C family)